MKFTNFIKLKEEPVCTISESNFSEALWRIEAIKRACEFIQNNPGLFETRNKSAFEHIMKDIESIRMWSEEAEGHLYQME